MAWSPGGLLAGAAAVIQPRDLGDTGLENTTFASSSGALRRVPDDPHRELEACRAPASRGGVAIRRARSERGRAERPEGRLAQRGPRVVHGGPEYPLRHQGLGLREPSRVHVALEALRRNILGRGARGPPRAAAGRAPPPPRPRPPARRSRAPAPPRSRAGDSLHRRPTIRPRGAGGCAR